MNNTINVHAQFKGEVAEIIDEISRRGRAAPRTEAIRLAILDYKEHHLTTNDELVRLAVEKMQKLEAEITSGRRKTLTAKEAMGEKWAKMLEEK